MLQFVVLSVIARSVSIEDYGLYLMCLSLVFSLYYLPGLGTSESGLAQLSRNQARQIEKSNGEIIGTVMVTTLSCAGVLIIIAILFMILQPFVKPTSNYSTIFVLVFISMAGIVFNVSQLLIGLGKNYSWFLDVLCCHQPEPHVFYSPSGPVWK